MADYYVHLNQALALNGNKKLMNTINDISKDDKLIITMDSVDSAQSVYLTEILENKGFNFIPKGSHDGNEYSIIAQLK